jgi:DNA-binding protein HU-beta|tara:strand:+ start:119 stop:433 length:315 start_codon:yes stop_codon:yes gene_type:complete
MNKAELIVEVQKQLGGDTSKAAAEKALNAVLESVKVAVKGAGKDLKKGVKSLSAVQLVGFGTFSVAARPARESVNPQNPTGPKIKIKAGKVVKFKPGSTLKDLV